QAPLLRIATGPHLMSPVPRACGTRVDAARAVKAALAPGSCACVCQRTLTTPVRQRRTVILRAEGSKPGLVVLCPVAMQLISCNNDGEPFAAAHTTKPMASASISWKH